MTPDESRDSRRIDGLLANYGELMSQIAHLDARADSADREREALRQTGREVATEFRRALEAFDRACDKKVERLEKAIEAQRDAFDKQQAEHALQREKDRAEAKKEKEEQQEQSRWKRSEWIGAASPIVALLALAIAILQHIHP